MSKWEDLKVYRNLPRNVVPLSFKLFAHYISEKLGEKFQLKESKTKKKLIYENSGEFEISIYFDNGNRWEKNETNIKIYIGIRPKYQEVTFPIIEPFRVNNSFKMGYPLTKEFLLLADSLIKKIENDLISYLDKISSSNKIIGNSEELKKYYTNEIDYNSRFRHILFESAFLERNTIIFNQIFGQKMSEENEKLIKFPEIKTSTQKNIESLIALNNIFNDDNLFKKEFERRNTLINNYKPTI